MCLAVKRIYGLEVLPLLCVIRRLCRYLLIRELRGFWQDRELTFSGFEQKYQLLKLVIKTEQARGIFDDE
ncbi:MAG: hypothetical protein ACL7AX_02595 [Candidatus Arsenophonus phytopathogenicus]